MASGEGTEYALLVRRLPGEKEAHMFLSAGAISCLESDGSGQGSFGLSAKENVSIGRSGSALLMASQEWPSGADFVFSGGSTASPAGFWPTTPGLRLVGSAAGRGGLPGALDCLAELEPATAAE